MKASLVYRVCSRSAGSTQRNLVLKNQSKPSNQTKTFKTYKLGPGEDAQWLRSLMAFLEDSGLIPSTHMAAAHEQLSVAPTVGL